MKMDNSKGFGTRAIHAGNVKDKSFGALTMPIYQTSTFVFDNCEQGARRFALEESGFIYSRLSNPTSMLLEEKIANLEGGEACMVMSSGMGAISSVFWSICRAGAHIVADTTLYGCTYALLAHGMTRYGVEVSFIDTANLDEVKKELSKKYIIKRLKTLGAIVYFECIKNI